MKAARKHIRVVLIQESESDANSIVEALRSAGMQAVFERVESKAALATALTEFDPDVVLSDYSVSHLDFREALSVVQSVRPYTPLIVITDLAGYANSVPSTPTRSVPSSAAPSGQRAADSAQRCSSLLSPRSRAPLEIV